MNLQRDTNSDTKHKRKIVRRHGACIECQKSKIKCDGDRPCGTCRTAKRKPKDCKYSSKAERAKIRRSHQCDSKMMRNLRDGQINDLHSSLSNPQHSRLATPLSPSEPANQDPYLNIDSPLAWMCRPLVLSSIVEEYSTLVRPKSSHASLFERLQDCAKELKDHIYSSHKHPKSYGAVYQSNPELKRSTRSLSPSCVAAVWEGRLATLKEWIEDGELSRARRSVASLKKDIETYMDAKDRAAQVNDLLQKEAIAVLAKLLELDYMLAMFLECQSTIPFWKRPGLLRSTLDQIKEENSHSSSRVELLETLHAGVKLKISDETCIFNFVEECLAVRQKRSSAQSSCITTYSFNNSSEEYQDLKLFSSLFLMMLYCRTANIERYCNHRKSQQGKSTRASNSTASVEGRIQTGTSRAKSIEHQFIIKHANHALVAFRSLCENDRQATAKSWFRLHGALIAALLVGVASVQKGRVANESNLTETVPAVRECFKSLEGLNPGCIIFQQAETIFGELANFQRRYSKMSEVEISLDMPAHAIISQVNCDMPDLHTSPTQVNEPVVNYQNPMPPMELYRHPGPPYAVPLPFEMIHPPMRFPEDRYWSTEHDLTMGQVWYGAPTGTIESAHASNCVSGQSLDQPIPQAPTYNHGVESSPPTTEHAHFVNITAENYEKDVTTDVRMLVADAGPMSQPEHCSSFESLTTATTTSSQSYVLTPAWQGYYPSQDSVCALEHQRFSSQGNLYVHDTEPSYPTSHAISESTTHSLPWAMSNNHQQYDQLQVTQGSTTCW